MSFIKLTTQNGIPPEKVYEVSARVSRACARAARRCSCRHTAWRRAAPHARCACTAAARQQRHSERRRRRPGNRAWPQALCSQTVDLVFTAHPTQAFRQSLLKKYAKVSIGARGLSPSWRAHARARARQPGWRRAPGPAGGAEMLCACASARARILTARRLKRFQRRRRLSRHALAGGRPPTMDPPSRRTPARTRARVRIEAN
jgi:hypothetical protein